MLLRPPVFDDAPAIAALLARRELVDLGEVETTIDQLLHAWRAPGFTLAADAVIAELPDGEPGGYAVVAEHGASGAVPPEQEGNGIGTALLRWVEKRERELGRTVHQHWYVGGNERARRLFEAAGYTPLRSYSRMSLPLGGFTATTAVPAGFSLRTLAPQRDGAALHALDNASFAANPDYQPETLESFHAEHLENPDFDGELSRVAEREGRITGFVIAARQVQEKTGFIDILAVAPEHQGHGLGRALLLHTLTGFAAAGLARAELGVASDNTRARALYEQVGMHERVRRDVVQRGMN
jgi:mycothiol synthase